ncbi:MAG TPA: hypothetical protein PLP33_29495 [Leptospiraceae bacterium]|nr:hypothetical protein [Leptospiraceae bacterium]
MEFTTEERARELKRIAKVLSGTDTYYTRLSGRVERAMDRLAILEYFGVSEQFKAYVERKAEMLDSQIELSIYFV